MVLHHACRGFLRTIRVSFSALLFCTRQALGERQADINVGLYLSQLPARAPFPHTLSCTQVLQKHATRDCLHPSPIPFSTRLDYRIRPLPIGGGETRNQCQWEA